MGGCIAVLIMAALPPMAVALPCATVHIRHQYFPACAALPQLEQGYGRTTAGVRGEAISRNDPIEPEVQSIEMTAGIPRVQPMRLRGGWEMRNRKTWFVSPFFSLHVLWYIAEFVVDIISQGRSVVCGVATTQNGRAVLWRGMVARLRARAMASLFSCGISRRHGVDSGRVQQPWFARNYRLCCFYSLDAGNAGA